MNIGTRAVPRERAKTFHPGSQHYSAYVGPPAQYDFMGATQFRLLATLGLRETHKLLDFGCGSLRAGRLLIPYLLPGNYYGIEPNAWLIEDAIRYEIGDDLVRLKRPTFRHNDDFLADGFGVQFDFVVAQSIFSHAGPDIVRIALESFRRNLCPTGLAVATFIHVGRCGLTEECTDAGWKYPGCVAYHPETILSFIGAAGLAGQPLPWYHPRQAWYAMAQSQEQLVSSSGLKHLSGAVLRTPEFADGI